MITLPYTACLTQGSSLFYQLSLHLNQGNTISTDHQRLGGEGGWKGKIRLFALR